MSEAPLRVELESFCQQFGATLEPFSEALDRAAETLRQAGGEPSLPTLLNKLQDNQHRLKILLDKAQQQNTYLVIFGPLKSGKSTLMNAISGAYVSEVTSLPAYPCLVYVHEGETAGFSSTTFNGDCQEYSSHEALHESLEAAHQALAERLRAADAAGTPFNPAQDFTEAIRRIDFTMPAPYLRESGTILVDTPGLYTKMKYNYGQLTRDFRDTAACAVFVVKTDNLFFEQVFEEFTDLLDIFSRVFLVVNIDSSKQDLGADGQLRPSLEQRDPKRIVEAFENLTVSAQIRSAIDSGRLRIYLIDLLQTASKSLQSDHSVPEEVTSTADPASGQNEAPESHDDATTTPVDAPSSAPEHVAAEDETTETIAHDPEPRLGFDTFLEDLTDYLNSSEYIVEFMSDSLRQADSILHEVRHCARAPEVAEYRAGIERLQERVDTSGQQLQSLDQLRRQEWSSALAELTAEIRQQVTEHSGAVLPELEKALHGEVETWALSEESMRDLVTERICARIKEVCQRGRARAIEIFDRVGRNRNSGIRIGAEASRQLAALDLNFDDIYPAFQSTIREQLEATPELPDPSGLQDALPLRRRFIDWLLFRSAARVRQQVFGPENPSERAFSTKAKAKRLSEEGTQEFCAAVGDYARQCHLFAVQDVLENLLQEYQVVFQTEARQRIEARQHEVNAEYEALKSELEHRKQILLALDAMQSVSDELEGQVGQLQNRYVPHKAVFDLDPE